MPTEIKIPSPNRPVRTHQPVLIQAVYGLMVDPHTGYSFNTKPTELLKLTPWVQSQLDAGKLKLL